MSSPLDGCPTLFQIIHAALKPDGLHEETAISRLLGYIPSHRLSFDSGPFFKCSPHGFLIFMILQVSLPSFPSLFMPVARFLICATERPASARIFSMSFCIGKDELPDSLSLKEKGMLCAAARVKAPRTSVIPKDRDPVNSF